MELYELAKCLTWKIEPYKKFPRLKFFDYLKRYFWYDFQELNFYWEQANKKEEDFYNLVFEKLLYEVEKWEIWKWYFDKFLEELWLSNFVKTIWFPYEVLLKEFDILKQWNFTSQEKGKRFEEFLKKLFDSIPWLKVINSELKQASDEQIDLIIQNSIDDPFIISLNSPVIIWEAKNWTQNTPTSVVNTLDGILNWHENLSKVWIVIALNWFTKETDETLKRKWWTNHIIVKIDWESIEELLEEKKDPIEWFKSLISKSFV